MNITIFKRTRSLHKWLGLVCFIFILILSVSGVLLMHSDSLELEKKMVAGQYLPDKYFNVAGSHRIVQSLAVTPENQTPVLFAGTGHGLFRSVDAGKTWAESKQGLFSQDIRALAVHPENSNVIYAGTPKGIFKSEDQGESWSEWFDEASGLTNVSINDLRIDPRDANTLYAATPGGLFVSHGGGEFWEPAGVPKSPDVRTVRFSAAHPGHIIIGTSSGAFRSDDGGKHWEQKWESLPRNISSLIALNTDPEFIFAGTKEGLFKSFNGGLNWLEDKHPDIKGVRSLFKDSRDAPEIYLASRNGLFFSRNAGDTWQDITPNRQNIQNSAEVTAGPINAVASLGAIGANPPLLLAGSDTGLFISDSNGKSWNFIDLGESGNGVSQENFKMDLAKLVTEIHTGRFFGDYFYWLVDLSTLGLIALAISGLMVVFYRAQIKKGKALQKAELDRELQVDRIIDITESLDNLSVDGQAIHDMVEHINHHIQNCKSIYSISKEKEEIEKVGRHIVNLDRKMHDLMEHINGFGKLAQDMPDLPPAETVTQSSKAPEETTGN